MFVGPVFNREVAIAPRRLRIYVARTTYVAGLLLLVFTAWMVLCGSQNVSDQWVGAATGAAWERLHVGSPNDITSANANFVNNCH